MKTETCIYLNNPSLAGVWSEAPDMNFGLILLGVILIASGIWAENYTQKDPYLGLIETRPYDEIADFVLGGGILSLIVGLLVGGGKTVIVNQSINQSESRGTTRGKRKIKVIAKSGATTAKCPICQFPLDVTTQTEGTCPKCKNEIEVFFEG